MKKRIICFGDSNTWGYDAGSMGRFEEGESWPDQLQERLGEGYEVIPEGLGGRTAVMEDPLYEGTMGLGYIHPCLLSHSPIALVIIMLGTNDAKERFSMTASNIAVGVVRVALKAKNARAGRNEGSPRVLVLSPPPIGIRYVETESFPAMGKGCSEKTEEVGAYLRVLCTQEGLDFIDLKGRVAFGEKDHVHLDRKGHEDLAEIVHTWIVKEMRR